MTVHHDTAAPTNERTSEYLTFRLGDEEYGIDILTVQEIRGYDAVTKIANAPAFIKGVINLRGVVVPVFDMRLKFSLGKVDYDQFTVVIILTIAGRVVGMVVDAVSDVIALQGHQINAAPELGTAVDTSYIDGLVSLDARTLILVDLEKLLASNEIGLVEQVRADAA